MVCRQWNAILSAWRARNNMPAIMQTSVDVSLHTSHLCIWALSKGGLPPDHHHWQWHRCVAECEEICSILEWTDPLTHTCTRAAGLGFLGVLKWASNPVRAKDLPWDCWTMASAALHGHLDVMMFLRGNGCPWNAWRSRCAALNGHLALCCCCCCCCFVGMAAAGVQVHRAMILCKSLSCLVAHSPVHVTYVTYARAAHSVTDLGGQLFLLVPLKANFPLQTSLCKGRLFAAALNNPSLYTGRCIVLL